MVLFINLNNVVFQDDFRMISFLKDRKQQTVLSGQCSSWGDATAGVSQGSILGPLLFLVYINDLTTDLKCNVSFLLMTHPYLQFSKILFLLQVT